MGVCDTIDAVRGCKTRTPVWQKTDDDDDGDELMMMMMMMMSSSSSDKTRDKIDKIEIG